MQNQSSALDCSPGSKGYFFEFSKETSDLGQMIWMRDNKPLFHKTDRPLLVPLDVKLWFRPGPEIFEDPIAIRQLQSAKLYGVLFQAKGLQQNILDARPRALSDCIASLPRSVKAIAMENIKLRETDQKEMFYKVGGLERLYLRNTTIAEVPGVIIPELSEMMVLELDKAPHDLFLDKLAAASIKSRLVKLGLERSSITTADIKKIGRLKSLTFLSFIDCFRMRSALNALRELPSMPNLTDLALSVESIDDATLKEMIKFKNLRRLHIYNGALLEPTIKRKIETILPTCKIMATEDRNIGFNQFQTGW